MIYFYNISTMGVPQAELDNKQKINWGHGPF